LKYIPNVENIKIMNWQVIAQLLSAAIVFLAGPIAIVLIAFRKGNL
jgi:Photosystem II complex subunit Ycf12